MNDARLRRVNDKLSGGTGRRQKPEARAMRLICPRCGAQYEIDAAAIPAAGRDVACSACEHVWRAGPAAPAETAAVGQRPAAAPIPPPPPSGFDPAARPALNRPLSDSVVEILREEAARELDARAAESNARRATQRTAAALAGMGAPRRAAADLTGGGAGEGSDTARVESALPSDRRADDATQSAPASGNAGRMHLPSDDAAAAGRAAHRAARRRHDAGFHLALVVALIAVALYAVAPRLASQGPAGSALMRWHAQVDQARDWLTDQGDRLITSLKGD